MTSDVASASDRFKEELSSLQHRYHIHHPFDKLLQSGRATREVLQMWAANRYYYQDTIPRKDAAIIANCPHSERRGVWAKHVVTHDVDGALSEWLLLTDALGLERRDVVEGRFLLPATRFACDAYLHFCKEADWRDGMCASMTHLFAGDIHRLRIKNWPDRYPWLPPSAFVYFEQRTKTLPSEVEATLSLLSDHYTSSPERMERAKQILSFKQDILWCMMDALWHHFFAKECAIPSSPRLLSSSSSSPSLLRILGSGAGGGVPQWNGTDDWNQSSREGRGERRTQCSAAILCPSSSWGDDETQRTGEGEQEKGWILVNCSPDFRSQWNDLLVSHPGSVLRGILFTDAELDHVSGLLSLRESKTPLLLFGTESIQSNIESTGIPSLLRTYTTVEWGSLHDLLSFHPPLLPKEVDVRAVSEKRPRCAYHSSDVLSLRGEGWVYAPCIPTEESLLTILDVWDDVSLYVTDGTFFSKEEMPSVRGHVPVETTLSLFEARGRPPPLFTRLNHTNQRMDPSLCLVDGEEIDLRTLSRRRRHRPSVAEERRGGG